jgi:D-glycero-D-manno-heptose 1,7-bisphosphate phosphatase
LKKTAFLDRDGIINLEIGEYISKPEMFALNPGAISFFKYLIQHDFQLIVITNQGGIAKGLYSHETLAEIHLKMVSQLAAHQITLTDIFYCPHHPDFGLCLCRKPLGLLIEKAAVMHQSDLSKSFMIGDKERDKEAATAAGILGITVPSNSDLAGQLDFLKEKGYLK